MVVVGRDGEPTPQCPDVWHGRLLRWGNPNLRTGELKPPYRGTQTPVQGNSNPGTGEDAYPRRGERLRIGPPKPPYRGKLMRVPLTPHPGSGKAASFVRALDMRGKDLAEIANQRKDDAE